MFLPRERNHSLALIQGGVWHCAVLCSTTVVGCCLIYFDWSCSASWTHFLAVVTTQNGQPMHDAETHCVGIESSNKNRNLILVILFSNTQLWNVVHAIYIREMSDSAMSKPIGRRYWQGLMKSWRSICLHNESLEHDEPTNHAKFVAPGLHFPLKIIGLDIAEPVYSPTYCVCCVYLARQPSASGRVQTCFRDGRSG